MSFTLRAVNWLPWYTARILRITSSPHVDDNYNAWSPSVGFHLYLLLGARKYFNDIHLYKALEGYRLFLPTSSQHGRVSPFLWGEKISERSVRYGNLLKSHMFKPLSLQCFVWQLKEGRWWPVTCLQSFCCRCVNSCWVTWESTINHLRCFPQGSASLHWSLPVWSRTVEAEVLACCSMSRTNCTQSQLPSKCY